jgi:hypothetical protein
LSQLVAQFGLPLRRDQGQEFGVVCQEGLSRPSGTWASLILFRPPPRLAISTLPVYY